jgi:cytosine deaminase
MIAELPDVLMGFKAGRQTFERQRPVLFHPAGPGGPRASA